MIALDIYLDDQFVCRAAMTGKHVLTVGLHTSPTKNSKPVSFTIMGNDLTTLGIPQQLQEMPLSKKKFVDSMNSMGQMEMYQWLIKKLGHKFKIDIHVVEAELESISPAEIIKLNTKDLSKAIKIFGDGLPPA